MKVSTAAFKDTSLSVDRRRVVETMGEDHQYTRKDGVGVAEFSVELAVGLGLDCVSDETDDNPAHALVNGKKTRPVYRRLRDGSTFLE